MDKHDFEEEVVSKRRSRGGGGQFWKNAKT